MENIYLVGSEDVYRASNNMREAADTLNRAVGNLDDVFFRQQRFMEDWLAKLEQILVENKCF